MTYLEYVIKVILRDSNLSDNDKASLIYSLGQYYGTVDDAISNREQNRLTS